MIEVELAFSRCKAMYKRSYTIIGSTSYGCIAIIRGKFVSENKGFIPNIHQLGPIYYIVVPFRRATIRKIIMFDALVDKYL